MSARGTVFSLLVILSVQSCVAEESLTPDNGIRVLDGIEQSLRRIAADSQLPAAALRDAKVVVDDVEGTVASVQSDRTLTKDAKAGKVLNAIQELQNLQHRWERNIALSRNSSVVEAAEEDLLTKRLTEKEAELTLKKKELDLDEAKLKVANIEKEMLAKKEELQRIMEKNSAKKIDKKPAAKPKRNAATPVLTNEGFMAPPAKKDALKKQASAPNASFPSTSAATKTSNSSSEHENQTKTYAPVSKSHQARRKAGDETAKHLSKIHDWLAASKPTRTAPMSESPEERDTKFAVDAGKARAAKILAKAMAKDATQSPTKTKMFNLDSMGAPGGSKAREVRMPSRALTTRTAAAVAPISPAKTKASVVAANHIAKIAASLNVTAHTKSAIQRTVTESHASAAKPALRTLPHVDGAIADLRGSLSQLTRLRGMASRIAEQEEATQSLTMGAANHSTKKAASLNATVHTKSAIQKTVTESHAAAAKPALRTLPHVDGAIVDLRSSLSQLTRLRGMASRIEEQSEKAHSNFLH